MISVVRDVALLILGIVLIVDAAFGRGNIDRIVEISVGLVLIGVLPIDVIFGRFTDRLNRPTKTTPPSLQDELMDDENDE